MTRTFSVFVGFFLINCARKSEMDFSYVLCSVKWNGAVSFNNTISLIKGLNSCLFRSLHSVISWSKMTLSLLALPSLLITSSLHCMWLWLCTEENTDWPVSDMWYKNIAHHFTLTLIETLSSFWNLSLLHYSVDVCVAEKKDRGVIYITNVCYKDSLTWQGLKQCPQSKLASY